MGENERLETNIVITVNYFFFYIKAYSTKTDIKSKMIVADIINTLILQKIKVKLK